MMTIKQRINNLEDSLDKDFLLKLENFIEAALELNKSWENSIQHNKHRDTDYPFEVDFIEKIHELIDWRDTQLEEAEALQDEKDDIDPFYWYNLGKGQE